MLGNRLLCKLLAKKRSGITGKSRNNKREGIQHTMDIYDNENASDADLEMGSVTDVAMAAIGLSHIAYIRPDESEDGDGAFVVCAADGSELASFDSYDSAYYTARQYNLQPVMIH